MSKTNKRKWYTRLWLWLVLKITYPIRWYWYQKMYAALDADITEEYLRLKARKPHWTEKQLHKRARQKYYMRLRELKLI